MPSRRLHAGSMSLNLRRSSLTEQGEEPPPGARSGCVRMTTAHSPPANARTNLRLEEESVRPHDHRPLAAANARTNLRLEEANASGTASPGHKPPPGGGGASLSKGEEPPPGGVKCAPPTCGLPARTNLRLEEANTSDTALPGHKPPPEGGAASPSKASAGKRGEEPPPGGGNGAPVRAHSLAGRRPCRSSLAGGRRARDGRATARTHEPEPEPESQSESVRA
jgi:hypothetical protein